MCLESAQNCGLYTTRVWMNRPETLILGSAAQRRPQAGMESGKPCRAWRPIPSTSLWASGTLPLLLSPGDSCSGPRPEASFFKISDSIWAAPGFCSEGVVYRDYRTPIKGKKPLKAKLQEHEDMGLWVAGRSHVPATNHRCPVISLRNISKWFCANQSSQNDYL